VDNELKEILAKLGVYLKKRRKKIVGWVLFIFGICLIIVGFFIPVGFILGSILTIIGGIILREELKKLASFLKPFLARASSFGPALVILGFILIIIGIPFSFFLPALFGWGILFFIIGIPLATTNLLLKHHVIDDWGHLIEGAQRRAEEIFKGTGNSLKKSGVSSLKMERKQLVSMF